MPLPKLFRLSYVRTGYSVSFLSDARTSSMPKEKALFLQHVCAPCACPACIRIVGIKMVLRMNAALLSVALALLSSRGDAFSTPASAFVGRSRTGIQKSSNTGCGLILQCFLPQAQAYTNEANKEQKEKQASVRRLAPPPSRQENFAPFRLFEHKEQKKPWQEERRGMASGDE